MRVLLTGSAGFIGARVALKLIEAGHKVVGIDNLNDAYDPRLKQWRLKELKDRLGLEFYQRDITDLNQIVLLFAKHKFEAVVNLAARAGVRQSIENPQVYIDTNVTGTLNLLEFCKKFGVKKFVLASTSSLYGNRNPRPFCEDANTDYPLSPYAASKKGAEALAATYSHLYQIDIAVLRYFTVYGPASRPDMSVFRFIQGIAEEKPIILYGDGSQERDFTFIDDIAEGTLLALKVKGFEIINLGGDRPVSITKMIGLVEKYLGKKSVIHHRPLHPADMSATWADINKAKKLLGWSPKTSFEEGIQKSVEWYLVHREWASQIDVGLD